MVLRFYRQPGPWVYGLLVVPRKGPPVGMKIHGFSCQAHLHPGGAVLIGKFTLALSPHLVLLGIPPGPHIVTVYRLLVGGDVCIHSC